MACWQFQYIVLVGLTITLFYSSMIIIIKVAASTATASCSNQCFAPSWLPTNSLLLPFPFQKMQAPPFPLPPLVVMLFFCNQIVHLLVGAASSSITGQPSMLALSTFPVYFPLCCPCFVCCPSSLESWEMHWRNCFLAHLSICYHGGDIQTLQGKGCDDCGQLSWLLVGHHPKGLQIPIALIIENRQHRHWSPIGWQMGW